MLVTPIGAGARPDGAKPARLADGINADNGAGLTRPGRTKARPTAPNPSAPAIAATAPMSDAGAPAQPKSLAAKAIDKVKEVAKSASDIFSRVPCLPPKGGARSMGSLPHVAGKLASGQPVVIVAFGSSSTAGYGTTSPEFTYPNRLAAQLHRQYPGADITDTQSRQGRRGRAGDDEAAADRGARHAKPDLVIWQVGTNAVLRNLDPADTAKLVEEGIAQHPGRRRRSRAGRSAIFPARHRARRKREPDGEAARQGRRAAPCRHLSRASR